MVGQEALRETLSAVRQVVSLAVVVVGLEPARHPGPVVVVKFESEEASNALRTAQ